MIHSYIITEFLGVGKEVFEGTYQIDEIIGLSNHHHHDHDHSHQDHTHG